MQNRCYLASYRPLVHTAAGRDAVRRFGLPPFIDGSCRREPDFESVYPSITSTCRAGNFAPRLAEGDRIAYVTVKGSYSGLRESHWRVVALLRVLRRFESHADAASWYATRGQPPPSNCLVARNLPKRFEFTNQNPPAEVRRRVIAQADPELAVRLWDAIYRGRVAKWPVLLATEPEFLSVTDPPHVCKRDWEAVFGRIPATLNPPQVDCSQLTALLEVAR